MAVARSGGSWTTGNGASNATFSNASAVTFPTGSSGTPVITHFSIGYATSGAGQVLFSGALASSLTMAPGITPSFAIGDLSGTLS